MLVGHHLEYELLEVPAVIFVVTVRDLDNPGVFIVLGVIVPVNTETGRVSMEEVGAKREFFHDSNDDIVEQVGTPILVDTVERAEEDIVVQVVRGNTRAE